MLTITNMFLCNHESLMYGCSFCSKIRVLATHADNTSCNTCWQHILQHMLTTHLATLSGNTHADTTLTELSQVKGIIYLGNSNNVQNVTFSFLHKIEDKQVISHCDAFQTSTLIRKRCRRYLKVSWSQAVVLQNVFVAISAKIATPFNGKTTNGFFFAICHKFNKSIWNSIINLCNYSTSKI